jgi:hypothetical protein
MCSEEAKAELLRNAVGPFLLAPCDVLRGAALIGLGEAEEGARLAERSLAVIEEAVGEAAPQTRECRAWVAMAAPRSGGK